MSWPYILVVCLQTIRYILNCEENEHGSDERRSGLCDVV